MRLICPNCGAQYEVPTEVIPENGRDVQCSDCGTTWFQHHPDHAPTEPEAEAEPPADDHVSDRPEPDDVDYGWDDAEDNPDPDPEPPAPKPSEGRTRREIDPHVADVLREEAEREARARQKDLGGGLETQQELGLSETGSDAARRTEQARARMARLRGEADEDAAVPTVPERDIDPVEQSSRSNLLPDIDEINSSLRHDRSTQAVAAPAMADDGGSPSGKGGFGKGFRLAVILAVLAALVYVFAPQLAETVPALAEPLAGFTETVNGWRVQLNALIEGLMGSPAPNDG